MSKQAMSAAYEEILLEDLKDPAEAAAYLEAALEDEDPSVFLLALRQVVQALGIANVVRKAHMGRESLYKTLSENGNPELRTIIDCCMRWGCGCRWRRGDVLDETELEKIGANIGKNCVLPPILPIDLV